LESHQLVNAFQHLQNQLLLQIQLIQESATDLQTSHEELKQAYEELQQMQQTARPIDQDGFDGRNVGDDCSSVAPTIGHY